MYRDSVEALKKWKENPKRKPLIIYGARQVGKTWLMKEFGRTEYENLVYISCDGKDFPKEIFSNAASPKRIIRSLETWSGKSILPGNTLLILDEIQEAPEALSSLKYFAEEAPEYHIICAGSLLGVALHNGTSFPVGKVNFLYLYPLSFREFLCALDEDSYVELLSRLNETSPFREQYIKLLKLYYFVGGMPEAVLTYVETHDVSEVRKVQQEILSSYEQDFSKHAPSADVPKIRMLWNSIPAQLAKENRKFIYGAVREGARAKEYERALLWLQDCGLVYKVNRVPAPKIPLKAYEDGKAFKLYLSDTGLLSCLSGLSAESIFSGNKLFTEFKGALTEQYVLQELKSQGKDVFYWTNDMGTAELDFLLSMNENIIPVEVKAETNLQAKSLKVYREKYNPEISLRISMADFRIENDSTGKNLINLPLYMVSLLEDLSLLNVREE